MALPLIAGAVASRLGVGAARRAAGGFVRRAARRGLAAAAPLVGRAALGARIGRRRRGIPSLSPSEMGKLMLMAQVLGRRSPAMTLVVMKALRGRI